MYNSQAVIGYPTRTSEKVWRTEIGVATCEAAGDSVPNWAENIKGLAHRSRNLNKNVHKNCALKLPAFVIVIGSLILYSPCMTAINHMSTLFLKKNLSKFSLVWWLLILWCGTRRMLYRQENIYIWRLLQCIYTRWDQM